MFGFPSEDLICSSNPNPHYKSVQVSGVEARTLHVLGSICLNPKGLGFRTLNPKP